MGGRAHEKFQLSGLFWVHPGPAGGSVPRAGPARGQPAGTKLRTGAPVTLAAMAGAASHRGSSLESKVRDLVWF